MGRRRIELLLATVIALSVAWFFDDPPKQRQRNNALVDAILRRDIAGAEALLRRGADVDAGWNTEGLWHGSHGHGTRFILEFMVNLGVDFHGGRFSDHSVLFLTALRGDVAMTKLLLRYGANVNARSRSGRTPLTWARRGDSKAVIALLEQAGAREGTPDPPVPAETGFWGGYPR